MKAVEHERQDWTVTVIIILVIGFVLVIIAGQLASRFSASWQLNTNMESHLDPNRDFLTRRPGGFIEPVDASILTAPAWIDDFLTPGVSIITGTPFPTLGVTATDSPAPTTISSVTNTPVTAASPTNTLIFVPSTPVSTRKPKPTKTSPPATVANSTSTSSVLTSTPTATSIATQTATATVLPAATFTPTNTPAMPPEIGTTPDGVVYTLPAGGALTLSINLIANGDGSFDLVYYERPAPSGNGIFLDWVIVEISDGTNWYTIFNWGDNVADTNSNMDFNSLPNPQIPEETDQRDVPAASLYNGTGIAIDVDAIVPPGTYSVIRFRAPLGDSDNQMEIDAVEVLP
jgi:hypothetical protein